MPLARRELLALGAIGAAAAAAGALFGVLGWQSQSGAAALLAEPFVDLEGRTTRLQDWSAKVLLCNFWATWCEPCREEIPLLIAAKQQFSAKGLEIAGIGIDSSNNLREFARKYGIIYPILAGTAGSSDLLRLLGDRAAALPFSVLLDSGRRIVHRKLGAWNKAELEREIVAAIG
jgi:thiol-disulfide isomerase/thioredoxin